MRVNDPRQIELFPSGVAQAAVPFPLTPLPFVSFTRQELSEILTLYGQRVAEGEWRDYAIDMMRDKAIFSIFRRTSEMPLYRIEKNPKLSRKQGAYAVITAAGQVLKRGHELEQVLRVLKPKPKAVV